MKKVLRQFRYFGKEGPEENALRKNYPLGLSQQDMETGEIFYQGLQSANIASLKIQTLPGIKFRLGDEPIDYIIVGSSGIYELTLADNYEIGALRFVPGSLELVDFNPNAYLIIDVVYNVEE